MRISGELYNLPENCLSGKLQRVVLNGQMSPWRPVLAGILKSSNPGSTSLSFVLMIYQIN